MNMWKNRIRFFTQLQLFNLKKKEKWNDGNQAMIPQTIGTIYNGGMRCGLMTCIAAIDNCSPSWLPKLTMSVSGLLEIPIAIPSALLRLHTWTPRAPYVRNWHIHSPQTRGWYIHIAPGWLQRMSIRMSPCGTSPHVSDAHRCLLYLVKHPQPLVLPTHKPTDFVVVLGDIYWKK